MFLRTNMDTDFKKNQRDGVEALEFTKLDFSQNMYQSTWHQDASISSLGQSLNISQFYGKQPRQRHHIEQGDVPPVVSRHYEKRLAPLLRSPSPNLSIEPLNVTPLIRRFQLPNSAKSHPHLRSSAPLPERPFSYHNSVVFGGEPSDIRSAPFVTSKPVYERKTKSDDSRNQDNLSSQTQHTGNVDNQTDGNKEDKTARRNKREERSRPWAENTKLVTGKKDQQRKSNTIREIHYEKALPPERWAKTNGMKYTKNPKWGTSYVVNKTEKGKVVGPGQSQWLKDDGFRTWLLEKSKDKKMEQTIARVMDQTRLKRVKGKTREELEILSTQKTLYNDYQKMQEEAEAEQMASVTFQKLVRGWIQRKRMKKLRQRVLLEEGRTLKSFMSEYRGVMCRLLQRKDQRPEAPFNLEAMNDYLDRKSVYKNAFIKFTKEQETPGYLPAPSLAKFFKLITIGISEQKIEQLFNTVFMVCKSKADVILMVDLPVSLGEDNFRIQSDFMKEIVKTLHIGRSNVRLGYLPYNSEVFVSFDLGQHNTKKDVLKALDKVRYSEGINRTDLAIKRMRAMFKEKKYTRYDGCTRKIAMVISEGGGYASHSTLKQAQEAIKKDDIEIYGIALGKNANTTELIGITGDEEKVMVVQNYYCMGKVRNELLDKANLRDCQFCEWQDHASGLATGRGLTVGETLELIWLIWPPGQRTRVQKKGNFSQNFFNDDHDIDPTEDGNGALFDTCLGFLVKARLEHEGIMNMPAGDTSGATVPVTTWREAIERASEFKIAEEIRLAAEEEEAEALGHPDNIITGEELNDGSNISTQEKEETNQEVQNPQSADQTS